MYRIKSLREDHDLSQKEVAKIIKTTQQQYSKIETGKADINGERLILLSAYYNVSVDLYPGADKRACDQIKAALQEASYMYRIKDLREDHDLSQSELSKYLHISQQQYSNIESGKCEITAERLIQLSKFYNVSVDYILGLTKNPAQL